MLSLARIPRLQHPGNGTVRITPSMIGSGTAIAPSMLPEWENRGGVSVYIIAVAAVTLEIIRDRVERASSLAGSSFLCWRPIPPRPDPTHRLSGDQSRVPGTAGSARAAARNPTRVGAV